MKSLGYSVLIVTIAINLVNGQGSRFFYKNREESKSSDESKSDGLHSIATENGDTKVKLLEENNMIPLDFLEQINNVNGMEEFLNKFVETESIDPQFGIHENIGGANVERAAENIAKNAFCEPESTVVPLEPLHPSTDPSTVYYPTCTRVKRCSGCCTSPLLSCQPTEVETVDFTIIKLEYKGKSRMTLKNREHVLVEQHKQCKCLCRIKKEDCNSYQVYDPSQCRCNCTNYNARDKCLAEEDKIWDYKNCKCKCRETQECTTGTYFDDHLCKCTEVFGSNSTNALSDRRRFILKAVPVDTNNKTIYNTA